MLKKRPKLRTAGLKGNIIAALKNLNQIIKIYQWFDFIKSAVSLALHSHSISILLKFDEEKYSCS